MSFRIQNKFKKRSVQNNEQKLDGDGKLKGKLEDNETNEVTEENDYEETVKALVNSDNTSTVEKSSEDNQFSIGSDTVIYDEKTGLWKIKKAN